ncbi:MAG: GNAT family N-acetyltransferase [Bdellovibrionaceae bacterium]|nr:GNAT family N-acetyltransferase [Pseudobdellovibrionaceae bacterium]
MMYTTVLMPPMLLSPADSKAFFDQIYEDNLVKIPDASFAPRPSAHYVFSKDGSGSVVGGGFVQFNFDVALIDVIWVSRRARRLGLGREIYRAIERLAAQKGMRRAIVSTFEFQGAIPFWEKMGFESFAVLSDYPEGQRLIYFQKKISLVQRD